MECVLVTVFMAWNINTLTWVDVVQEDCTFNNRAIVRFTDYDKPNIKYDIEEYYTNTQTYMVKEIK